MRRLAFILLAVVVLGLLMPAAPAEARAKVTRFVAWEWKPGPPGIVRIEWETVERDNLSWTLLRETGTDTPFSPICVYPGCRELCRYQFACVDEAPVVGARYWLVARDYNGVLTWFGPVRPELLTGEGWQP